jgi:release factor glutamine methyltransferase
VTPDEEVGSHSIEAAWAGGTHGRLVIDQLLPLIPSLLSEKGLFYLVTIKENKPDEIIHWMNELGLSGKVVLRRKAGSEGLAILRFSKTNYP